MCASGRGFTVPHKTHIFSIPSVDVHLAEAKVRQDKVNRGVGGGLVVSTGKPGHSRPGRQQKNTS